MNQPAQQHSKETYRGPAPLGGDAAVITGADIGLARDIGLGRGEV